MNNPKPFGGISGSTLKLIAIVTMFIDHLGATVLRAIMNHPDIAASETWLEFWKTAYNYSRNIGRIAFPIFCFLIVEGFTHTRNVWKYAFRMFLFALISEIPFDIALKGNWYFPGKQNVYFTLLIGLLVLIGIDAVDRLSQRLIHKLQDNSRSYSPVITGLLHMVNIAVAVLTIWAGMRLASRIDTDYNFKGVFLIAVLYLAHRCGAYAVHGKSFAASSDAVPKGSSKSLAVQDNAASEGSSKSPAAQGNRASRSSNKHVAANVTNSTSHLPLCFAGAMGVAWELPAPLAFIPVYLYNGTRGLRMKYFFYWFYPVHLLILHVVAKHLIPLL